VWHRNSYSLDHAFWVFLPLACLPCLTILLDGWQLLWFPHPACRTEAFILNGIQDAALSKPLYPPFGQMPYLIRVYNPLTYLPAALIGKALRLDVVGMLLAGRLISFISSLTLAALLFVWLRKYAGDWKAGLLAAVGLWFYHDMTLSEFFRLRPESPALLFTFAGVAVFLSQHRHRLFIAAGLFFVAFLFKQWFIAAPISAALFLLLSKEYKNALRFASMMAGLLAVFFFAMYALTGANYFYDAMVALAVNEMHPIAKFLHFRPFITASLWSLILALPVALALLLVQRRCRFLLLYFCVSLLWTFFSTDVSYLTSGQGIEEIGVSVFFCQKM
jgi:hypothetical protein